MAISIDGRPEFILNAAYGRIRFSATGDAQVAATRVPTKIRISANVVADGDTLTIDGHVMTLRTIPTAELHIQISTVDSETIENIINFLNRQHWFIEKYQTIRDNTVSPIFFFFTANPDFGEFEIPSSDYEEVGESLIIVEEDAFVEEVLEDNYFISCITEVEIEGVISRFEQLKTGVLNRDTGETSAEFDVQIHLQSLIKVFLPDFDDDNVQFLSNMALRFKSLFTEQFGSPAEGKTLIPTDDYLVINAVVDYKDLDVRLDPYSFVDAEDTETILFLSIIRTYNICPDEKFRLYTFIQREINDANDFYQLEYKFLQDNGTFSAWKPMIEDLHFDNTTEGLFCIPAYKDNNYFLAADILEINRNKEYCIRLRKEYIKDEDEVVNEWLTPAPPAIDPWIEGIAGGSYVAGGPDQVTLLGNSGIILKSLHPRTIPVGISHESRVAKVNIRLQVGFVYDGEIISLRADSANIRSNVRVAWTGQSTNPGYFTLETEILRKSDTDLDAYVNFFIVVERPNGLKLTLPADTLDVDSTSRKIFKIVSQTGDISTEEFCLTVVDCCNDDQFTFLNKLGAWQNIHGSKFEANENVEAERIVKQQAEEIGDREMIRFDAEITREAKYEFPIKTDEDIVLLQGFVESNDIWVREGDEYIPMIILRADVTTFKRGAKIPVTLRIADGFRTTRQFINELGG